MSNVRPATLIGWIVVIGFFCAPLFVGLGGWDLRNDEALYTYAVDRMLDTGEWLTPRSIQVDGPFLEKPPLKFWMVAMAIKTGLVPRDEFGYRAADALMGALAFLYVYAMGLRIAGPIAGAVAVLCTFSMASIVFDHGIRSNNMEAPLLLAYCGGLYHFMRVVDRSARPHLAAVYAYFVLAFMTKFVAALFLPIILAVVLAIVPEARTRVVMFWRAWLVGGLAATLLVAPWFLYESARYGREFWRVIFGEHVYTRFTASLDPAHVQPWYFYFARAWRELEGKAQGITALAVAAICVAAWRGRDWRLRLLLVWWIVPFMLLSIGTSKLFHYAYPFLPPVALAVGWMAATVITLTRRITMPRISESWPASLRYVLASAGAVAIALAAASALFGQVVWTVGGVKLLQNSTVVRPLVIAAMCFAGAGYLAISVQTMAVLALLILLPVERYSGEVSLATTVDARLRTIRACAERIQRSDYRVAGGVLNAARAEPNHADYYYLSQIGQWDEPEQIEDDVLRRRLFAPGEETIVRFSRSAYDALMMRSSPWAPQPLPPAVAVEQSVFLFPGLYAPCAAAARAAVSPRLLPAGHSP